MKKLISTLLLGLSLFTLVGCSSSSEGPKLKGDISVSSLADTLNTEIGVPMGQEADETIATDLFHLNLEDVNEYKIYHTMVMNFAANIAVVEAKDGKADAVATSLEQRKEDVVNNFKQYLPDQLEIAESGKVIKKGNYVVLIILEDMTKAEEIVENSFE